MAGFTKARVLSIETMIEATARMISLREWVLVPQALRTKGKGNSESFQGLDKSRRNPRGPGRGRGIRRKCGQACHMLIGRAG